MRALCMALCSPNPQESYHFLHQLRQGRFDYTTAVSSQQYEQRVSIPRVIDVPAVDLYLEPPWVFLKPIWPKHLALVLDRFTAAGFEFLYCNLQTTVSGAADTALHTSTSSTTFAPLRGPSSLHANHSVCLLMLLRSLVRIGYSLRLLRPSSG